MKKLNASEITEPDRIWLQPACCADPCVGRLWCEDPDPEPCEDGIPWTEYVKAEPPKVCRWKDVSDTYLSGDYIPECSIWIVERAKPESAAKYCPFCGGHIELEESEG